MNHKLTELYLTRVLLERHDEEDMSQPEEQKEVDIGKKILELITVCETSDVTYKETLEKIKTEATKLLKIHKAE